MNEIDWQFLLFFFVSGVLAGFLLDLRAKRKQ
jgi:hypothetical protein